MLDGGRRVGMSYTKGVQCWNGPARCDGGDNIKCPLPESFNNNLIQFPYSRSTKVTLACGAEDKLISATEPGIFFLEYFFPSFYYFFYAPGRCEYEFHFETPSACGDPKNYFGGGAGYG